MKNSKNQLPEKKVQTLYQYSLQAGDTDLTTTSVCSDPTTTCTTVITTTHFR
jgi:hypothetical protein